jgi:Metallo-beta-lactamase superfamily
MGLDLQFLNARQGDAIWIRWGNGHQIIIDMGTASTGVALADRIRALPEAQRHFDLLVVTHVDVDHIGGVLQCVTDPKEPVPGLTFDDVWFNGFEHLSGLTPAAEGKQLEPMGGVQGEVFAKWLREQPWNVAFDRAPVVRGTSLTKVELDDGLALSVLGPAQERLTELKPVWKEDVEAAIDKGTLTEVSEGLEGMGPSAPPVLESKVDLELLAEATSIHDSSKANGSSITLLLEWEGRRILLTGDAYASEVVDGLALVDGGKTVPLDLFKLPHHGSRNNLSQALVEAVDCPLWVFSSDGTTFRHPDPQAIARILLNTKRAHPTLAFNVPSKFNGWWDNDDWRGLFDYEVQYGDAADGITLSFDPVN